MTNDQMREAFEAHYSDGGAWPQAVERDARGHYRLAATASAWLTWQAGVVAGMERAAGICDDVHQRYACCEDSKVCADEIRAEIPPS